RGEAPITTGDLSANPSQWVFRSVMLLSLACVCLLFILLEVDTRQLQIELPALASSLFSSRQQALVAIRVPQFKHVEARLLGHVFLHGHLAALRIQLQWREPLVDAGGIEAVPGPRPAVDRAPLLVDGVPQNVDGCAAGAVG